MLPSLFEPFQRMFDYRGRARRREYWLFVAWQVPVVALLLVLGINVFPKEGGMDVLLGAPLVYAAVFGLPMLALQVRRLHDQDKSGWWLLITLLPYLGLGWLLYLMLSQGTWGPNRYGPDPRQLWEGDLFE
jgi:uncharacterized membrane protein YhaH (DUF805 family)